MSSELLHAMTAFVRLGYFVIWLIMYKRHENTHLKKEFPTCRNIFLPTKSCFGL